MKMRIVSIGAMAVVAIVLVSLSLATFVAASSLEISQTSGMIFTALSSSSDPTLVKQWNYQFGCICYRMIFGPSPAVADLGYGDENLEIVTGNDEWYPQPYVSGRWFAFDANGKVLWTLNTGNDESRSSVAIADIDNDGDLEVIGGTTSGCQVQVFNHLGRMVWIYSTYGMVHSSPAVADVRPDKPGLETVAASYDGKVYSLDSSGRLVWSTYIGAYVSSPAVGDIDADGKLEVVVGSLGYRLYVLDGATGSIKWTYQVGYAIYSSAALADLDGDGALEVIIGAGYDILSINGATGSLKWKFRTGGFVASSPAIGDIDDDGKLEVVVGSNDGKIYSLDGATGTLEWSYATGGAVWSSPALANRGSGGLGVYVGSDDKYLYLIDGKTGALIDRFLASGPIRSSPIVADIDGDQKLEILFTDWNQAGGNRDWFWVLEDTGSVVKKHAIEWGMFRHDERRTGLYTMVVSQVIDRNAPTSSVNTITPYWRSAIPFTATATAFDDLSGVSKVELFYRYSSDNRDWGSWMYFGVDDLVPWEWSFTGSDGYYEFYSIAVDRAGNIENAPGEADARAGVDTIPPTTTHSFPGTAGDGGWWRSNVTVTLSATDAISGVSTTIYRVDGGAWQAYSAPFAVSGDGTHTVEYYSVDRAGNTEPTKSVTIKIDTMPPASSVDPISPYWRDSTTITLTATATDALSGVASVTLYYRHSADNLTFTGWTEVATDTAPPWEWTLNLAESIYYEFYSVARDVAGNTESPPTMADARCAIKKVILATVRIKPEVIDLTSNGVFTAFITLPGGYSVTDIDLSTIVCEGAPARSGELTVEGELAVKFKVQDLTVEPGMTELVITGALIDGTQFIGSDFIIGVTDPSQGGQLPTPPTPPPDQPESTITIEDLAAENAGSATTPVEGTISAENAASEGAISDDVATDGTTVENMPLENLATDNAPVIDATSVEDTLVETPAAESVVVGSPEGTIDSALLTAPEGAPVVDGILPSTENTVAVETTTAGGALADSTLVDNPVSSESMAVVENISTSVPSVPTNDSSTTDSMAPSTLESSSIETTSTESFISTTTDTAPVTASSPSGASSPTIQSSSWPMMSAGGSSGGSTSAGPAISAGGSSGGQSSMSAWPPVLAVPTIAEPEETENNDLETSELDELEENTPASSTHSHDPHSGQEKTKASVKIEPDVVEIGGKEGPTASIGLTPPRSGIPLGALLAIFSMLAMLFGAFFTVYVTREMRRQVKEISRDLERVKSTQKPPKGWKTLKKTPRACSGCGHLG